MKTTWSIYSNFWTKFCNAVHRVSPIEALNETGVEQTAICAGFVVISGKFFYPVLVFKVLQLSLKPG